jgi:uncharacterized protein YktB (UPF0637 family)
MSQLTSEHYDKSVEGTQNKLDDSVRISQENFNFFCEALNHRMTRIENDVRWMKRIGYYMAGVISAVALKILFV